MASRGLAVDTSAQPIAPAIPHKTAAGANRQIERLPCLERFSHSWIRGGNGGNRRAAFRRNRTEGIPSVHYIRAAAYASRLRANWRREHGSQEQGEH
jgi:hypothetical protein